MSRLVFWCSLIGLLSATPALAREVAGVKLPDRLALGSQSLVLNGAGVRSKFFVKVYVGALYLPAAAREAAGIIATDAPLSIQLHFLHSEVEAKKLVDAWNDGFNGNHTPEQLATLRVRIERFNAMFRTVKRGDVVRLDYLPGGGTVVAINDEVRGTVEGADFRAALLRIWLGEQPADGDLKRGLLGE